ncbi:MULTISPECIES: hypothetical protein [Oceanibaculum]|uniref:Uncharacterized protein n=1 Tax=Oceanibaculum pacificum TaxID=580166 RepID=A0A154VPE3_9PROT|nr:MULTISPECIES: hypothetical protein [Oceanibaculum]KZD03098.1 hypothetical protein AUP43_03500 [Oceanibaculum pacificum]
MGFFDHFISGRKAMPDQPDDIMRLRQAHHALEDLPETIILAQQPGGEARAPLQVVEATVDEIAFGIIAAEQECSAAYRRSAALQRLYKLAREAGCIGSDRAAPAVQNKEGQ